MNYYQPLKRESDGRWDFTVTNDGKTRAVGYCHAWKDWHDLDVFSPEQNAYHKKAFDEQCGPFRDKYHNDGHVSAEEASACYRAYLLDQRLQLRIVEEGVQRECLKCGTWTTLRAQVECLSMLVLCEEHQNKDTAGEFVAGVSVAASSY